jgi:hypothetical protein
LVVLVPGKNTGAADDHFAFDAGARPAPLSVEHANLRAGDGQTDAAGPAGIDPVGMGQGRFSRACTFEVDRVEELLDLGGHGPGHGGGDRAHEAQRSLIGDCLDDGLVLGRLLQDGLMDRRNSGIPGRSKLFHPVEESVLREPAGHHGAPAEQQRIQ